MINKLGKLIAVGEHAPDFELAAHDGTMVQLNNFRGQSEVVLYFYPKDETPGCTVEACTFRDGHAALCEGGAVVLGISSDSGTSHRKFAAKHDLPYHLLSDPSGEVRRRYGVGRTLGLLPGRVTFVIDRDGIVRHVYSSQFRPASHVKEALDCLRRLRSETTT